ncbi:MAG TPA: hydrogenase assembly protein HupF [Ignisphaera aggregans]|uniref:Hydrogenase assembly protein HupF n=1 Tax=Ignisphaera aggregans TaxID=334771 RepID=A0A833DUA0_9CREN|nr:hydrogenase assembly protein HupF [Ignisphaera aggregans]
MPGKLRPEVLKSVVFPRTGLRDLRVVVGPKYGEDAAIIDLGAHVLVVHSDPITAAIDLVGWLAVHIASNDVAVRGAKPSWLLSTILLPESEDYLKILEKISTQIDQAAKEIEAQVVGGHTEVTPELSRPIVVMTAMGVAPRSRYVTTSGARVGDVVLMTKTVAIEGTAIIATDFEHRLAERGVPKSVIESAKRFYTMVSVVREALRLAELGVSSMHDPTEGGVIGGLVEIANASNVKIVVYENSMPIAEETRTICKALGVDPLKLISSGTLIATLSPKKAENAIRILKSMGINASIVGKVVEGKGVEVHRVNGSVERVEEHVEDEIYRLWSEMK